MNYKHMTDKELLNAAFMDAETDLEKELYKRYQSLYNDFKTKEDELREWHDWVMEKPE